MKPERHIAGGAAAINPNRPLIHSLACAGFGGIAVAGCRRCRAKSAPVSLRHGRGFII